MKAKIIGANELPQTGLLRLKQVLEFVPISPSSWWQGVRQGRYPQPVKLSPRVTCWKMVDILRICECRDQKVD